MKQTQEGPKEKETEAIGAKVEARTEIEAIGAERE